MSTLSERDYLGILDVVREAALGTVDAPMPEAALAAVRRLIPAESVAYFRGSPRDRRRRRIWSAGGPREFPQHIRDASDAFRWQSPITPSPATMGRAVRISDFLDRRAYHRLDLYNLVGRPLGIESSMDYWFQSPDGPIQGLALDTDRPAFSDRDRDVLEVLGGQLQRLACSRVLARRAQTPPTLTRRETEILGNVARGRTNVEIASILRISPTTVRTHLENAFVKLGVHTRAAAVAVAFDLLDGGRTSIGPRPSALFQDERARHRVGVERAEEEVGPGWKAGDVESQRLPSCEPRAREDPRGEIGS
jgi:DNA-binding CsgD family transcriptional regulator